MIFKNITFIGLAFLRNNHFFRRPTMFVPVTGPLLLASGAPFSQQPQSGIIFIRSELFYKSQRVLKTRLRDYINFRVKNKIERK